MAAPAGAGLILYALTLGMVAAVNPCGLPLLPAYLALFTGADVGHGPATARALRSGAGVSLGFVAVFGILGLAVDSGVRLVTSWLPAAMILVAVGLIWAGLRTLAGRAPGLVLPAPGLRPGRSLLAMISYGVTYAIGSLSCALPLFLAAVGGSFLRRGVWAGIWSYLAYALGMGLFVTAASVLTATVGATALARLRSAARWLPLVSGVVATVSGGYLLVYWALDLLAPGVSTSTTATVGRLQGGLVAAVGADPVRSTLVLGGIVLVAITVAAARARTGAGPRSARPGHPARRDRPMVDADSAARTAVRNGLDA
jgi:cytochrome c biogenesis protein CcdA